MATAPDNGRLRPPGPAPLGAILVQRGVLTEDQLAVALDEQGRTGEQIGEVIVRLGFALAASVAQALATQHGGPLKSEYGYAVGFGGASPAAPPVPPPVSPAPERDNRSQDAVSAPGSALRVAAPTDVAPVPASLPVQAAQPVAEVAPDPALVQWQQLAQQLGTERDAALQQARALAAERDAASVELAATTARSTELESTSDRLAAELETVGRARDEAAMRVAELEQRLEEASSARSQVAELQQRLDELHSATERVAELEATTSLAEVERAKLANARDDAARRCAELAQELALVRERTATRLGELDAELAAAREGAARTAEAEHHHAELTGRIEELQQAANARERELATARSRVDELEAAAASSESEKAVFERAHGEAVEAAAQLEALREELARLTMENAEFERAQGEAALGIANLERQLAELTTAAAADDGHLAAATARVAELEAARAARESEFAAALAAARDDVACLKKEKAGVEAEHQSMAARNSDLEQHLQRLQEAVARVAHLEKHVEESHAKIAQLEAERNDVLAAARGGGEERRGCHPDAHFEDPVHLLFVPRADGYRLLEQQGPPPSPGSTLELAEADGSSSRLLVAKVGAAPLPGVRLACAYLVAAA